MPFDIICNDRTNIICLVIILTNIPKQVGRSDALECNHTEVHSHQLTDYANNSLIFKLWPFLLRLQTVGDYLVVFNKKKELQFFYDAYKNKVFKKCILTQIHNTTEKEWYATEICSGPSFVAQMQPLIFEKIDAIVDYSFGYTDPYLSGWLVLFNIDGRPKYCFTREDENISSSVRF